MADGSLSGVRGICTIGPLEQTAYASPLKATLVYSAESVALGSLETFAARRADACWADEALIRCSCANDRYEVSGSR
jgi:hypothetical protein